MGEALFAFYVALLATLSLYLAAKLKAPKSAEDVNKRSMYACGERLSLEGLKTTIVHYGHPVYSVLLDAYAILLALSSSALVSMNFRPLTFHLPSTISASPLLFTVMSVAGWKTLHV
ncbi:MAG: hypothetical protein ACE5Z5_00170 [Candidatus Bathyarchaeia archaeon]